MLFPCVTLLRLPVICRIRQATSHGDRDAFISVPWQSSSPHEPPYSAHCHLSTQFPEPGLFSHSPSACKAPAQHSPQAFEDPFGKLWLSFAFLKKQPGYFFTVFITNIGLNGLNLIHLTKLEVSCGPGLCFIHIYIYIFNHHYLEHREYQINSYCNSFISAVTVRFT